MCEDGYSSNGMPHALTVQSVLCGPDGVPSLLPAPCIPITHFMVGEVTNSVDSSLLEGAFVTVTSSDGQVHEFTTGPGGLYYFPNVRRGEVTIRVTMRDYTDWEATIDLQHDTEHGMLDAGLNPQLQEHEWRAVLTWLLHPRDLDFHVTRHQSPGGLTGSDPGSQRTHVFWRQRYMRSNSWLFMWMPEASLDWDNKWGNGLPETMTMYKLDTCEYDCTFVFRVWDYCSLDKALAEESGAMVRLYNSDGLHSTWNINEHGSQHNGVGTVMGEPNIFERRWDVFQLDASGDHVVVTECLEGACPADNTLAERNHAWC